MMSCCWPGWRTGNRGNTGTARGRSSSGLGPGVLGPACGGTGGCVLWQHATVHPDGPLRKAVGRECLHHGKGCGGVACWVDGGTRLQKGDADGGCIVDVRFGWCLVARLGEGGYPTECRKKRNHNQTISHRSQGQYTGEGGACSPLFNLTQACQPQAPTSEELHLN